MTALGLWTLARGLPGLRRLLHAAGGASAKLRKPAHGGMWRAIRPGAGAFDILAGSLVT